MKLPTLPDFATEDCDGATSVPRNSQFLMTEKVRPQKVCRFCRIRRRGAAVVEFAIVAPLFFLLIFGMLEFGRMVMVQQILTNASREGARRAVLDGASPSEVVSVVTNYLGNAGINLSADKVSVLSGTDAPITNLTTVGYDEPIKVRIVVPFRQVSWLPGSMFTGFLRFFTGATGDVTDINLTAQTVMRRETVQQ